MPLTDLLLYRLVGPFLLGHAFLWILHWTVGLIANVDSVDDEAKLSRWKFNYMMIVFQFKSVLWPWGAGILIFMMIGII